MTFDNWILLLNLNILEQKLPSSMDADSSSSFYDDYFLDYKTSNFLDRKNFSCSEFRIS